MAVTKAKKKVVKKVVKNNYVKKVASKKSTNNNIVEQSQTTTATYDIPDRTLRVAGISPAEQSINNANRTTNNSTYNASNTSGLTTKRYPGDDNPINTTWGYYKQTAQEQNQSVQKANNAQQKGTGASIPANTLKSIGY